MKKLYRRSISGLLALLICFTAILGSGMTAYAAAFTGETADSYSVAFPRDGDANLDYSGTWGHDELHYMNGWTSGEATWMTTLHTIGSFDGPACYCIEPGVPRNLYRSYESYGEDYWDTFPAEYNRTIDGRTMKTLLGRIMQYGYQGNLSLDWRSQNDADADKLAHMMATQVLVWETVVGERDADFNHIAPDNADAVKSVYRTSHPLYGRFSAYYDSIEASVKKHTVVPSFMDRSEEDAQTVELSWDGSHPDGRQRCSERICLLFGSVGYVLCSRWERPDHLRRDGSRRWRDHYRRQKQYPSGRGGLERRSLWPRRHHAGCRHLPGYRQRPHVRLSAPEGQLWQRQDRQNQ